MHESTVSRALLRKFVQLPNQDVISFDEFFTPAGSIKDTSPAGQYLIANNVIPHGDTIAGLKFIARRFVADCARAEHLKKRSFPSRLHMQVSMGREVAGALRKVSPTQQLA